MKTFAIAALAALASGIKLKDTAAGEPVGPPAGGPPADGPPAGGPPQGPPEGEEMPLPSEVMDMICKGEAECAFDSVFFVIDDNMNDNIEVEEFSEVANAMADLGDIAEEDAAGAIEEFVEEAGEDGATRDEVLGWLIEEGKAAMEEHGLTEDQAKAIAYDELRGILDYLVLRLGEFDDQDFAALEAAATAATA